MCCKQIVNSFELIWLYELESMFLFRKVTTVMSGWTCTISVMCVNACSFIALLRLEQNQSIYL